MSLTDPVADFLTRIRNSIRARHQKLDVPASRLKTEIARILKEEGYIANYKAAEEDGRAQTAVLRPFGELHLADEFGLDPSHATIGFRPFDKRAPGCD